MSILGGEIAYQLLKRIAPASRYAANAVDPSEADTKLEQYFGKDFFLSIQDKTVIDFGCGRGGPAVEMAKRGAKQVIGLDIQERLLATCREKALQQSVSDRCVFSTETETQADILISKDAFEHFADPAAILVTMASLIKPNGYVLAAFGPTWRHPYGGHLFSVFPWSHLLFSEKSQIRWRADFKHDGATKFCEVDGGLNQLTIAQFEQLVAHSPFCIEWLETVPIRGIKLFNTRLLREFGSSIVRCKLTLK